MSLFEKLRVMFGGKDMNHNLSSFMLQRDATTFDALLNPYGVLKSSNKLSTEEKRKAAICFDFKERAEVAMCAAQFFPGGDYFEFGSEGMGTFRNFLTAFDITERNSEFPKTEFYAFDIFGDMTGAEADHIYFKGWHDDNLDRFELAKNYVKQHGLFEKRTKLVKGFFKDTLNPEFKDAYIKSGKRIGFAFLDCNITNSYKTVFDFLRGAIAVKAFIYMDEYHCNHDVPQLYESFVKSINMESRFIRSAGAFGALFQIVEKKYS